MVRDSLRPRRVWAANLSLCAAGTAVALLLGELAVRLLAPEQLILLRPDIWIPADTVGWLARPNVRTLVNTGERTVHVYTDSDGFRVTASGRVEGLRKVLIIGDSFMQALQVEYEESFAGLLQQRLPVLLGQPVAIRNAGVDGWDPPQYLLRVRSLLAQGHYDAVVVAVYLGNDIVARPVPYFSPRQPFRPHRLRWPRALNGRQLIDAVFYPFDDFLKVHSELFLFLKHRFSTLLMALGLSAEYLPIEFRRSEAMSPRWQVTANILREISVTAASHGAPAIFVLIPAPFQADSTIFDQYRRGFHIDPAEVDLDQPNRLLIAALRARALPFLDALPYFRGLRASGQKLYGEVDRHLSPEGNAALERLAEPEVMRLLQRSPHVGGRRRISGVHTEPPPPMLGPKFLVQSLTRHEVLAALQIAQ